VRQRYDRKVSLKRSAQCSNFSGEIEARLLSRPANAGLDPAIHLLHKTLTKVMDTRVIQREDARSLSSGRALRGPVGAFARL
jgi:hypothetical protein